jgi:hypothetical protein
MNSDYFYTIKTRKKCSSEMLVPVEIKAICQPEDYNFHTRVRFPMVSLEFFIDIILFGRTMALGSIQPLTEINTRNISWGVKGGLCVGLTTLQPSCADCLEIWEPQPPRTLTACPGLLYLLLYCYYHLNVSLVCYVSAKYKLHK